MDLKAVIWIEGENPVKHTMARHPWWCDQVKKEVLSGGGIDFHIYESAADVRSSIGRYRELMAKYGVVKPIWSTELGINSQG